MKRSIRNVVALGSLIIIGSILASLPACWKYLAQEGLLEARRAGATLAWSDLTASMTEVRVGSFTVWLPTPPVGGPRRMRVPLPLEFTDLALSFTPASILSLSPRVLLSARAYEGEMRGEVLPGRNSHELSLFITNVKLARHPLLSAVGLRDGDLSGSLEGATLNGNQLTDGAFTLSLSKLEPPPLDDHLKIIKVDPLGPLDITARGSLKGSTVDVRELTLSSPLLTLSGSGTVRDADTTTPALSGSLRINLSPRGSQVVGPWLPLLTNGTAAADAVDLTCTIRTKPCGGGSGAPLNASLCLALTC